MRHHRDAERRQVRIERAEAKLRATAAVERKEVDPQKLASQVGRMLQRAKAHKYFSYWVDEAGLLHWEREQSVIDAEARLDGWYILRTNLASDAVDKEQVHAHYKQLMEVEAAFRELKTYLKVRPVYHYRVDRVRNHVRICFLAYWISARLSLEWRSHGETRRVFASGHLQETRGGAAGLLAWLTDVLRRIPEYKLNKVVELLPHRWSPKA
jgi:transposase